MVTRRIWKPWKAPSARTWVYAQLIELYGEPSGQKGHERKYSPAECTGARKAVVEGNPDKAATSTSHIERNNLSMRMGMRRFTRLTNGFSKKMENHPHMLSLYFVHYNFCGQHRGIGGVSRAMAAGVSDTLHDVEWIVSLIDARAPKPNHPKIYKKNNSN